MTTAGADVHTEELERLQAGVLTGERKALAQAITLCESTLESHRLSTRQLIAAVLDRTGGALRVGITGVPGAGKSTLIEKLGLALVEKDLRVAVLAFDPSSAVSGGSLLGDKTRMVRLAQEPSAFIRPSPSGRALGGVARATRESILICEAAGFDVVLVETVGIGQSESLVVELVDFVVLLALSGAGDELQGLKRGILEEIDLVAVNKADGDLERAALAARAELEAALRMFGRRRKRKKVLLTSGLTGLGLEELWLELSKLHAEAKRSGDLAEKRSAQQRRWLQVLIEWRLVEAFRRSRSATRRVEELGPKVAAGTLDPGAAADEVVAALLRTADDPNGR